MNFMDLPRDCIHYLIHTSPRGVAWKLSLVNKELRDFALPVVWAIQSVDDQKAHFLIENPSLSSLVRTASIIPCDLFIEPRPPHLLHTFDNLFGGFTNLRELTLPHLDDLRFLGIPPNLKSLHLTHAQPTPQMLDELAEVCPSLEELAYTMFQSRRAMWILSDEVLVAYARTLSKFRELRTVDLCASVHLVSTHLSDGLPHLLFDGEINLLVSDDATADEVALRQKRATLMLAKSCPRLRRVYWSSLGNTWSPRLDVSVWCIHGEEGREDESQGGVSCEGTGCHASTYGETFYQMRILVDNFR